MQHTGSDTTRQLRDSQTTKQGDLKVKYFPSPLSSLFLIIEREGERAMLVIVAAWLLQQELNLLCRL